MLVRRGGRRIRVSNKSGTLQTHTTRPWPCATIPQAGQPITVGSDSTVTVNRPPASRSTVVT
jgi:hypothetical protein